jgi:hypothetical protein
MQMKTHRNAKPHTRHSPKARSASPKIAGIDIVFDPRQLRQLDLVIPGS